MTFNEAMNTLPTDFLRFSGTATRSEFWYKFLTLMALSIIMPVALGALAFVIPPGSIASGGTIFLGFVGLSTLVLLVAFAYSIPLFVRRIKDTGLSGWTYLAIFILCILLNLTLLSFFAWLMQMVVILYCGLVPTSGAVAAVEDLKNDFGFSLGTKDNPEQKAD